VLSAALDLSRAGSECGSNGPSWFPRRGPPVGTALRQPFPSCWSNPVGHRRLAPPSPCFRFCQPLSSPEGEDFSRQALPGSTGASPVGTTCSCMPGKLAQLALWSQDGLEGCWGKALGYAPVVIDTTLTFAANGPWMIRSRVDTTFAESGLCGADMGRVRDRSGFPDYLRDFPCLQNRPSRLDMERISMEIARLGRRLQRFKGHSAAALGRARRAQELTEAAIRAERLSGTPPLQECLYARPRRVGRACGSRHRVMLC